MTDIEPVVDYEVEVAAVTDVGTERDHNEDACGSCVERKDCVVVGVADGVSSSEGGEIASAMAIDTLLRAYREEEAKQGAGTRLYRAVQQANIEVYDKAVVVTELRGMATTLTAVAVEHGELTAVHVGDSRLYLVHEGVITQLTKDHTLAAERSRMGLLSKEKARTHPDRCKLTRSVGRELIVNRDRISRSLIQGDMLLVCSDGLHTVLEDEEIAKLISGLDATAACRALIDAANERGTPDNLTAAVVRVVGPTAQQASPGGIAATLRRWIGKP